MENRLRCVTDIQTSLAEVAAFICMKLDMPENRKPRTLSIGLVKCHFEMRQENVQLTGFTMPVDQNVVTHSGFSRRQARIHHEH